MKYTAALGVIIAFAPETALAICFDEPLGPKLRSAHTVYVGTVVRSELVPTLDSLRKPKNLWQLRAEVKHTLVPEITLKGDATQAQVVFSNWQYNDPRSETEMNFAERSVLMPGDTILVVATRGEETPFGLCTPSREWNRETAKIVYSVFPRAP